MATNWTSHDVDRAVFENFAKLQGCANDPMEKSRLWTEFERFSKYGPYDFNSERPKPWTAEQTADLNRTLQRNRHADEMRRRGHYHEPGQVEQRNRDERARSVSAQTSDLKCKLSPESESANYSREPHKFNAVPATNSGSHRPSELSSEQRTSRLLHASKEPCFSTRPDPSPKDEVATEDHTMEFRSGHGTTLFQQESTGKVLDQFASRPQKTVTVEETSSTTQLESTSTVADQSSPQPQLSEVAERCESDETDYKAQPEFTAHEDRSTPRSGSTVKERLSSQPSSSDMNAETAETRPDSIADDERSSTLPQPTEQDIRRSFRPDPMPFSEDKQSTHSDLAPDKSSGSPASASESVENGLPTRRTDNRPRHDAQSGNSTRSMNILILWIGLHGLIINPLGTCAGVWKKGPRLKSGKLMLRLFTVGASYLPP